MFSLSFEVIGLVLHPISCIHSSKLLKGIQNHPKGESDRTVKDMLCEQDLVPKPFFFPFSFFFPFLLLSVVGGALIIGPVLLCNPFSL